MNLEKLFIPPLTDIFSVNIPKMEGAVCLI